jgi:hypothetical protein
MTGKAMLDPLVITGLRQKGIGAKKNSFWLTRYSNTPSTSPFSAAESRLSKGRDQCAQVNVLPAQEVNAYVCWNSSTPPEFKNVRYGSTRGTQARLRQGMVSGKGVVALKGTKNCQKSFVTSSMAVSTSGLSCL